MATDRKIVAVVSALAVAITVAIVYAAGAGMSDQQASGQGKYTVLKAAHLTARHAYSEELPTNLINIPTQIVLQNSKLQAVLQDADQRADVMERFCKSMEPISCADRGIMPIDTTATVPITLNDLNVLTAAIPFTHSSDDVESDVVMTKFKLIVAEYNGNNYVITVRSAWN